MTKIPVEESTQMNGRLSLVMIGAENSLLRKGQRNGR